MKKHFSSYWIRSAFYTFLQRFSTTLFGFINFAILIRTLDKSSQFGVWLIFLAVTGIFEMAKSNLLKNAHVRYVSGSDDLHERTVIASSSFVINISISFLFIIIIFFFSDWLSAWLNLGNELAEMLKWYVPGLLCLVFFSHLESIQQSHLDFKGIFAGYIVRQISFFIIIVTYKITNAPLSLTTVVMYQSLSIALGSIVLYAYTRKFLMHKLIASWVWVKKIVGYGGYIFSSGLVANIYSNLDQLMIARFMTTESVASYGAALRINGVIDIPSYAAADIIFPKASRASVEEGNAKVAYLFEKMVAILIAINIPITLFIIIFAKLITVIIASHSYSAAAPILQLYMVASIFRPVQNQAANLLNSIGKPKLVFIMNTITLVALLGINYTCLMEFGFYGVAIGTLITSMLGAVAWYFIMKKQINLNLSNVFRFTIDTYKLIFGQIRAVISKKKNLKEAEDTVLDNIID